MDAGPVEAREDPMGCTECSGRYRPAVRVAAATHSGPGPQASAALTRSCALELAGAAHSNTGGCAAHLNPRCRRHSRDTPSPPARACRTRPAAALTLSRLARPAPGRRSRLGAWLLLGQRPDVAAPNSPSVQNWALRS